MDFNVNYYLALGLHKNAELKDIKKAYYKLSFKLHPDHNKEADPNLFADITKAYDILMDENQKLEYDKKSKWGKEYSEYYELLNFEFNNDAETWSKENLDRFKKNELLDIVEFIDDKFKGSLEYQRWVLCKECSGSGKDLKSKIVIKDDDGNIKASFDTDDGCDFCEGSGKDFKGNPCGFCFGKGAIGINECKKCNGKKRILGLQKVSGIKLKGDKTKVEFMGNFSKDEPGKVGNLYLIKKTEE